ncbi:unnamed protein product [Zymoseptoria tritici ST99CH_3D1]|nr:unnamed protein product [Zymoseptoria tritici ST99CH_3D1]
MPSIKGVADNLAAMANPLMTPQAGDLVIIEEAQKQTLGLLDLPDELWAKIGNMVIKDLPRTQVSTRPQNELRLDYFRAKVFIIPQMAVLLKHRQKYGEYLYAIGADARRLITVRFNGGSYEPKDFSPEVKKKLKATLQEATPGLEFKLDSKWIGTKNLKRRWSSKMVEWTISFL